MWYINRKTNELVQGKLIDEHILSIRIDDYWELKVASQYGEAMVNNPMIPADDKPHIKDKFCDNLGCIPYIPGQKPNDMPLYENDKWQDNWREKQKPTDSEGLVENPYKVQLSASQAEFDAAKQRYEEAKKFYGKEADRGEFDTFREQLIIDNALARAYEEGCKAQKALCDAEKAEAVKKAIDKCIGIVKNEEELDGEMPDEIFERICALKDKEDATIAMRALVVATKESIETNLEAFKKQTLEESK